MRKGFVLGLASFLLVATPAMAGELNFVDGHTVWQSTQCQSPKPPELLGAGSETPANDMNDRVTQYNAYVQQAQSYMNCISGEAQRDANATSQAIIEAGQKNIAETQNNVARLGATLQKKPQ